MTARRVNMDTFYAAIDAVRDARGLLWRDVADQSGVAQSTLSRIANGNRPSIDVFAALVRWMRVPAEKFMPEFGPTNPIPKLEIQLALLLASHPDLSPSDRQFLQEVLGACIKRIREGQHR